MSYTSTNLEVLEGLEPVRRRPGMYTDTTRPNHLAQEVIDNAIDEALGGMHAISLWYYTMMARCRYKTMDEVCRPIFTLYLDNLALS